MGGGGADILGMQFPPLGKVPIDTNTSKNIMIMLLTNIENNTAQGMGLTVC